MSLVPFPIRGAPTVRFAIAVTTIVVTLACVMAASAQTASKNTVAKTKVPGTTGDAGNKCPGGSYNSRPGDCEGGNVHAGRSQPLQPPLRKVSARIASQSGRR